MKTMRPQRAVLPLAFLSAAFMLACHEQASSPVGPEGLAILLDKTGPHPHGGDDGGDNPGSPFYVYTFSGDITTDPSPAGACGGGTGGWVSLRGGGCVEVPNEVLIFLNQFGECFGDIGFDFRVENFSGTLRPDRKDRNKVRAVFIFKAVGIDPLTEFEYRLKLDGGPLANVGETTDNAGNIVLDAIFPPEPGETTTLTFTNAIMKTKGGKDNSAVACTGSVDQALTEFPASVELTGTS